MPDVQAKTGAALAPSLDGLASVAVFIDGIRKADLQPGDRVIVRTRNSTYYLRVNGDGTLDATGGWFLDHPQAGEGVRVAGCTWGGSALLTPVIAVPGMFLEFANGVRTTRIREARHIRAVASPTIH
jgi:hypothetical protein